MAPAVAGLEEALGLEGLLGLLMTRCSDGLGDGWEPLMELGDVRLLVGVERGK